MKKDAIIYTPHHSKNGNAEKKEGVIAKPVLKPKSGQKQLTFVKLAKINDQIH